MGPGFDTCWLTVNRDGMRYCCEVGFEPIVTNARMNTPGNVAWAIWDSHYPEHAQRQEPVKSASFMDGLEDKVEQAVADGAFFKSETLSELAEAIGVPADALQKTGRSVQLAVRRGRGSRLRRAAALLELGEGRPVLREQRVGLAARAALWPARRPELAGARHRGTARLAACSPSETHRGDFFANSYPVTPARHEPRPRHDLRLPGGPRAGGRHDHRRIRVRRSAVAPGSGAGSGAKRAPAPDSSSPSEPARQSGAESALQPHVRARLSSAPWPHGRPPMLGAPPRNARSP